MKKDQQPDTSKAQRALTFRYYEALTSIVRDMETLERLVSLETSRTGCLLDSKTQAEEMAIIESRKNTVLRYVDLFCHDHIIWSKKLLADGWTEEDAIKSGDLKTLHKKLTGKLRGGDYLRASR